MNALIVDDEKNARQVLHAYLKKYCLQITTIGMADSVKAASEYLNDNNVDIVFLDVEMPYGNAFDLLDAHSVRDWETVFVTAYDQYAMEALNQQAAYYLLKPLEIDELVKAVETVERIRFRESELTHNPAPIKENEADIPKSPERLRIPTSTGFDLIPVKDILYVKADDNYAHIFTDDDRVLVSKTLKYIQDLLSPSDFCRIHKSYLVNVHRIASYQKGKGGSVILNNDKELPVSASKKLDLFDYFE